MRRARLSVALPALAAAALALSACGSGASSSTAATTSAATAGSAAVSSAPSTGSSSGASGSVSASGSSGAAVGGECTPSALSTTAPGTLTIATSEPVFEPWMVDNDPTSGKGFESAVAYAVAEQLGYTKDQVAWTRVGFDEAIAKQDGWDFDINQFTITPERQQQVDFSPGYYDVTQVVVTVAGSPIENATTLAALKDAKLGAMNGTTSLQILQQTVAPSQQPSIYDDNVLGVQALQSGQIDGLVVDLPTAFYIAGAQLPDGKIVGQLPNSGSQAEQLGLLLAKGSPLTPCVSQAVTALRDNGTLDQLATEWLAGAGNAPVLS